MTNLVRLLDMPLLPGLPPKGDGHLPFPYLIDTSIPQSSPMFPIKRLLTSVMLGVAAMSTNIYLAVLVLKVLAFPRVQNAIT